MPAALAPRLTASDNRLRRPRHVCFSDDARRNFASQALATQCSLEVSTGWWIYPGLTHDTIIQTATMGDMVQWMADRFAGKSNPDPYQPTELAGIQTSSC